MKKSRRLNHRLVFRHDDQTNGTCCVGRGLRETYDARAVAIVLIIVGVFVPLRKESAGLASGPVVGRDATIVDFEHCFEHDADLEVRARRPLGALIAGSAVFLQEPGEPHRDRISREPCVLDLATEDVIFTPVPDFDLSTDERDEYFRAEPHH